jgi:glycosyltransferase involved in cell wall biosynthesis
MNQVNESFFDVLHSGERRDIVTVGKLRAQKNQALLIRAFSRIAGEIGDNLLLYGAGELENELRGLIESLHLAERVKLMGLSTDVANDIKDAKCFVMSSDYEGLPNALLEAMALGLPCVSTDCEGGGPAMMIKNGVNGLLVPMRDEKALADAMLYMLRNPEEAERMGRAARKTAEGFRPDAIFARWKQYAEDILNG